MPVSIPRSCSNIRIMTKQNRLRTMCEAYFVLWKTVRGDVFHAVDMAIGNVERQCQTTASNKKLSLFRKEGRATTLRREFEQTTANTRSKDANKNTWNTKTTKRSLVATLCRDDRYANVGMDRRVRPTIREIKRCLPWGRHDADAISLAIFTPLPLLRGSCP